MFVDFDFINKCQALVRGAGMEDQIGSLALFIQHAPTIFLQAYSNIYANVEVLCGAEHPDATAAILHSLEELRRGTIYGVKVVQKIDIIINGLSTMTKHPLLNTLSGKDVCKGNQVSIGVLVGILYAEGNRLHSIAIQRKEKGESELAARREACKQSKRKDRNQTTAAAAATAASEDNDNKPQQQSSSKLVPNSTDNPRNPFLAHILQKQMKRASTPNGKKKDLQHPLVISPSAKEIPGLGLEMIRRLKNSWQEGTEAHLRSTGSVHSSQHSAYDGNELLGIKGSARSSVSGSDWDGDEKGQKGTGRGRSERGGRSRGQSKGKQAGARQAVVTGKAGRDKKASEPGVKKAIKPVKSFGPLHLRRPLSAPTIHSPRQKASASAPVLPTVANVNDTTIADAPSNSTPPRIKPQEITYDKNGRKLFLDAAAIKQRDEEAARIRAAIDSGAGLEDYEQPRAGRKGAPRTSKNQRPSWPGHGIGRNAEEWVKKSRLDVLSRLRPRVAGISELDPDEVDVSRAGAVADVLGSILRDPAVASSLSSQLEGNREDAMVRALLHSQGALQRGDILLVLEHCHSCSSHATTMRHSEGEYHKRAAKVLRQAAREVHGAFVCVRLGVAVFPARLGKAREERSPSPSRAVTPLPNADNTGGATGGATPIQRPLHPWGSPAGHDPNRGRSTHTEPDGPQGRIGAFELHILYKSMDGKKTSSTLLHSKLRTMQWPSNALLASKIKTFLIKENVPTFHKDGEEVGDYADVADDVNGSYPLGTGPFDATPLASASWAPLVASSPTRRPRGRSRSRSRSKSPTAGEAVPPSPTVTFAADTNPAPLGLLGALHIADDDLPLLQLPPIQYAFDSRNIAPVKLYAVGCTVRVFYLPHPRGRTERLGLLGVVKEVGGGGGKDGNLTDTKLRVRLKYHHAEIDVETSQCSREETSESSPTKQAKGENSLAPPPRELALLFALLESARTGARMPGSPSNNASAAASVWKTMDKGDKAVSVIIGDKTVNSVSLTRASLFHQLRNLSWDLETKFAGPRGGLVENTLAKKVTQGAAGGSIVSRGLPLDLQVSYGEESLDWLVRFGAMVPGGRGCILAAVEEYFRQNGASESAPPTAALYATIALETAPASAGDAKVDPASMDASVAPAPQQHEVSKSPRGTERPANAQHKGEDEDYGEDDYEEEDEGGGHQAANDAEAGGEEGSYDADFNDESESPQKKAPSPRPQPAVADDNVQEREQPPEQAQRREEEDCQEPISNADLGNADEDLTPAPDVDDDNDKDSQSGTQHQQQNDEADLAPSTLTPASPLKKPPSFSHVLSNYLSSSGAGSDGSDSGSDMDADAIAALMGGSPKGSPKDAPSAPAERFPNTDAGKGREQQQNGGDDDDYGDDFDADD